MLFSPAVDTTTAEEKHHALCAWVLGIKLCATRQKQEWGLEQSVKIIRSSPEGAIAFCLSFHRSIETLGRWNERQKIS
jgi:hypothetical protein